MSKQYLTFHSIDDAHFADIYSLAVTPSQILSASGASAIKVHLTTASNFPIAQSLDAAHKLGCHHVVTSVDGVHAASVGFGGEVHIWLFEAGMWIVDKITNHPSLQEEAALSNIWAIALSPEGQYLAGTTVDGKLKVWELGNNATQIVDMETKGSFGMCIDLSSDGIYTATGHQNGNVYVFNNETRRMRYSLSGMSGASPVRTVAFSPHGKYLAAAGDSREIILYEIESGDPAMNLTGHAAWITSLDWNSTGEYLLSSSLDGKVKVWSIERRACVATHSESHKAVWSAKWLPKVGKSEGFATAGADRRITFYREATGG